MAQIIFLVVPLVLALIMVFMVVRFARNEQLHGHGHDESARSGEHAAPHAEDQSADIGSSPAPVVSTTGADDADTAGDAAPDTADAVDGNANAKPE